MDNKKLTAVTRSLDKAIETVANSELERLASKSSDMQFVQAIHKTLASFAALRTGAMPKYGEWDALLYSTWYQSTHINLAYSAIQKVPEKLNPLKTGNGQLYVNDFGCGELAMQFALVLAASDTLEKRKTYPQLIINSSDPCRAMTDIGWKIWRTFFREIGNLKEYPELHALRQVCHDLRFDYPDDATAIRWLSLFHVAYKEVAVSVNEGLNSNVANSQPDVVLVTFRQPDSEHAFSPTTAEYRGETLSISGDSFELKGEFELATKFRNELFKIFELRTKANSNGLTQEKIGLVKRYLTRHPTEWVTHLFEANGFIYTRSQANFDDIDDLPF